MRREALQFEVDEASRLLDVAAVKFADARRPWSPSDGRAAASASVLKLAARALVRAEDRLARGGRTDFSESRILGLVTTADNLNAEITQLQQQLGAKEMERARLDRDLRAARIAAVQGGVKIAHFVAAIGPCEDCDHRLCDLARRAQQPVDATSAAVKVGAA